MNLSPEQIRLLLIEKITESIDASDERIVDKLIAEDPAIRQQFEDLKFKITQQHFDKVEDTNAAWLSFEQQAHEFRRPLRKVLPSIAAAAAVLGIIATASWYFMRSDASTSAVARAKPNEDSLYIKYADGSFSYATPGKSGESSLARDPKKPGEILINVPRTKNYSLELSDGSLVNLNSQSKFRFRNEFDQSSRKVYLQGEASFRVSKDALRPFIVQAFHTKTQVLGTYFNVNAYDSNKVTTSLVEGSVLASLDRQEVKLKPGFQASFKKEGLAVSGFDVNEVMSWLNGVHYFHNAPLEELASSLSRWYWVDIHFENEDVKRKTFTGQITRDQPVTAFLENLQLTTSVKVVEQQGKIIFK